MTGDAGKIANEGTARSILTPPGQELQLSIDILDQDGLLYADEETAIATIDFADDLPGRDAAAVISGREAIASGGVFTFPSLIIRQTPDSTSQIELTVDVEVFGNAVEFVQFPPAFEVQARACIEGERYRDDLSCINCPAGYYLYLA